MRLHELVAASRAVAATRSRREKRRLLAAALGALQPGEREAGVSMLAGEPRQPRLELGPQAVADARPAAAGEPTLTVADIDAALEGIASVPAGTGSRSERRRRLDDLLARATADEQDWLRRLVLRELRQGALEGLLLQAAADATGVPADALDRAAMLSGDARTATALALTGGEAALAEVRLRVGGGIRPMLAVTAPTITDALTAGTDETVAVEPKLDGARVQAHRDGDQVTLLTRSLRDVTDRLPAVAAAVRALPARALVLDGEVLGIDDEGRPQAFQDTMRTVGAEADPARAGDPGVALRAFDLLHLDGVDVLDEPLRDRRARLEQVVPSELRVGHREVADVDDARAALREALEAGHEGLMVKDPGSTYAAGRRGAAWRKVKPVHTLDLLVLAAEWGSGRRRGWLSNLHLGARAGALDPDDPDRGVMLGKTFKGLTDETLTWQTRELLAREREREGHVVHVRPELVVEIAVDGVQRSPHYPAGLALRFARVRRYRPDKAPSEADDVASVRAIHDGRLPRLD